MTRRDTARARAHIHTSTHIHTNHPAYIEFGGVNVARPIGIKEGKGVGDFLFLLGSQFAGLGLPLTAVIAAAAAAAAAAAHTPGSTHRRVDSEQGLGVGRVEAAAGRAEPTG